MNETVRQGPAAPLRIASDWSVPPLAHPPVCDGDCVFVTLQRGAWMALDGDGETLWTIDLPGKVEKAGGDGQLFVVDSTTVIGGFGGNLYVVDTETGAVERKQRIEMAVFDDMAVGEGRFVVPRYGETVGTRTIAAYDISSGEKAWERPVEGGLFGELAVASETLSVRTDRGSEVFGWDMATGEQCWHCSLWEIGRFTEIGTGRELEGEARGHVLTHDGTFILTVVGHRVVGVDAETGQVVWKTKLSITEPTAAAIDHDDKLHVIDLSWHAVVDVETGTLEEEASIREAVRPYEVIDPGIPVFGPDTVYFVDTRKGVLIALAKATHDVTWNYQCGAQVPYVFPPVIGLEKLFVLDWDGHLHVFEAAN